MVEFITWLKAIAALLITNSHLGSIYPVESLATGGLLGNLFFFAVSGFCLYRVKKGFIRWYVHRLIRIYPAVWIITGVCLIVGTYHVDTWSSALQLFLYPTYYHFIASILICYIPFYFVAKYSNRHSKPLIVILGAACVLIFSYLVVYLFFYDYSFYHIDTVEEPMIRFAYFAAMLMGAWFRIRTGDYAPLVSVLLLIGASGIYLYTKVAVSSGVIPPTYQFVNQVSILCLLYAFLRLGQACDSYLLKVPETVRKPLAFIASLTLEIYLVQYLVFRSNLVSVLDFPLNLVVALAGIVLLAWIFHELIAKILARFISNNKSCNA